MQDDYQKLDIAIVGAGIIGVMVALGLLHTGHTVTIYERANDYFEMGVAMSFTGVARECMKRLDPAILEALLQVGEANRHPMNRYWDGFNPTTIEEAQSEKSLLFQQSAKELDYVGCLRSTFLKEMAKALPGGTIKFGKSLDRYSDKEGVVQLWFDDGTTANADALLACDGIHSKARRLLLGEDNPASRPSFTNIVAYRAIIPISAAIEVPGEDKGNNQCAHLGPGAHVLSFPVAQWTFSNVFFFLQDPKPWPDHQKTTLEVDKAELISELQGWGPAVRELAHKMPEKVFKWAILDMAENPADTYAQGRVALVGDAAHTSSPFHGAGACMGVEDALVLVTVLNKVLESTSDLEKSQAVKIALQAYSTVRLQRSQWLVASSRDMGEIYQWRFPDTRDDPLRIQAEIERRSRKIWDYSVDEMTVQALRECEDRLRRST